MKYKSLKLAFLYSVIANVDAMLIGFSPRKAEFSLYILAQGNDSKKLLSELGKYEMGKACIYFKKLSDVNLGSLEKLCRSAIAYLSN
jgi:hypothetical protein